MVNFMNRYLNEHGGISFAAIYIEPFVIKYLHIIEIPIFYLFYIILHTNILTKKRAVIFIRLEGKKYVKYFKQNSIVFLI